MKGTVTKRFVAIPARGVRIVLMGLLAGSALAEAVNGAGILCASPGHRLQTALRTDASGRLTWSLQRVRTVLIEPSPLGVVVDGRDLGARVALGTVESSLIHEEFDWHGAKSRGTNHCRSFRVPVTCLDSQSKWFLEVRMFDDGVAWRYRVPGEGRRHVQGEASAWVLPAGAWTWYQTDTLCYEGEYTRSRVEDIPALSTKRAKTGPTHLGPPVGVELPSGDYLLISEARLFRYSGMTLRRTGTPCLAAAFEDDPQGFDCDGEIVSPWRVTLAAADLQTIVNSDVIPSLCDSPDTTLFPQGLNTPWIKPGRALITWTVFGNDGAQWHRQKWFVDQCAVLRCEYLLVDGGWRTERWGFRSGGANEWARLRELCDYAASKDVGIVVWNSFPEGRDDGPGLTKSDDQREFFRRCREAGVKGVKIDFFESESKATIEAQERLLRLSAEHHLMINFHGSVKPTGEARTWPHQVTQEGIREQEHLLWGRLPLEHYAALPFTRMAVGFSDFLPTFVRRQYLTNTTATFQMATAIIATSAFLCWPDHPDDYLRSPFLDLIRAMPVVWNETRVLPGSKVGRLAAFARRAGDDWFVAVINGETQVKTWKASFDFLGKGRYEATVYRDQAPLPEGVSVTARVPLRRGTTMTEDLAPGGGFVVWIKPTH